MDYKLFLDDERHPYQVKWVEMPLGPWIVVRSYKAFVDVITIKGIPLFVSFDHDLEIESYILSNEAIRDGYEHYYNDSERKEMTGYDCAKWLIDYCVDNSIKFPDYQVHSMNPVGAENIRCIIENAKKHLNL